MMEAAEPPEDRRHAGRRASRERSAALAAAVVFLLVVLWGGYGHHWSWTGINGRTATLWDWLHLLLLPLLLPTLVVPALKPLATAGLIVREDSEPPGSDAAGAPGDGQGVGSPASGPQVGG
jgi:hypothetical protein